MYSTCFTVNYTKYIKNYKIPYFLYVNKNNNNLANFYVNVHFDIYIK